MTPKQKSWAERLVSAFESVPSVKTNLPEYMIKAIEILFFLASNEGFTMWPTSTKILDALFIALDGEARRRGCF
ncbi:hypothetical protein CLOP_g9081 [Closterium sp. NIES-67]|nr:hypothetical protein CLOP_g9081 [Closterium sp. NIES-67]